MRPQHKTANADLNNPLFTINFASNGKIRKGRIQNPGVRIQNKRRRTTFTDFLFF
jgi:hypothetical protein